MFGFRNACLVELAVDAVLAEMLGISYGELFLIVGATAALIGPKDLPKIARTAGLMAGRAIGNVQKARGQFDSVLQQSQVNQVHKELQDAMAQLDAIRYEVRSLSFMNPGPMTQTKSENGELSSSSSGEIQKLNKEEKFDVSSKGDHANAVKLATLHGQATAFERLAECSAAGSTVSIESVQKVNDAGFVTVLPISAESAGLLTKRGCETYGSDVLLEAIVEAVVAENAKQFFARPENQIRSE